MLDEAAGIAAVGPNEGEVVVLVGDLPEQHAGGGAVAGVCGGDHHTQQQTERVDHDVPFAAVDQLAAVEAPAVGADHRVRLDRLRFDQTRARLRFAAHHLAGLGAQPVVELLDQAVVAPAAKGRANPVPRREVGRHRPPLDAVVEG